MNIVNDPNKPFVAVPDFLFLDKQNLKYLDILVYYAIRSHWNVNKGYAYPSYKRIMEVSGLGKTFVSQSIKRLERAGHLKIEHSTCEGTSNRYYFGKLLHFERIPTALIKADDLSTYEKAMLIAIRQFFNHGYLTSCSTITEIANDLGLTSKQVRVQLNKLIVNGYIKESVKFFKGCGRPLYRYHLTDKIDWSYTYHTTVEEPTVKSYLMVA